MPKVSVILPVYNAGKYLENCLNSIINQTCKDIEIICVNDGSSDNSADILAQYKNFDNRIKIISQDNMGTGIARNIGIEKSTGKYLTFVDPDDWLVPDAIECFYKLAEETNANVVRCNFFEYKEKDKKTIPIDFAEKIKKLYNYDLNKKSYYNWRDLKDGCLYKQELHSWALLYRKEFITKHNIQFAPNKRGEDHIFYISAILLADKVYYLNKYLYFYRVHNESTVHTKSNDNFCIFDNIETMRQFLKDNYFYDELKSEFDTYAQKVVEWHYRQTPHKNIKQYEQTAKKYFASKKEFKQFLKRVNPKRSFIEHIFSVTNFYNDDIKYKLVIILGIKIKIKRKQKKFTA